MIKLFDVYYPVRTLILLGCEALIIGVSFVVALLLRYGQDSYLVLNFEAGWIKIIAVTLLTLLCSYYFDLYAPQRLSATEIYVRLLLVMGTLSFLLAGLEYLFPRFIISNNVFFYGLIILSAAMIIWRKAFLWVTRLPFLQERIYVIGSGERARSLVDSIRSRPDLGMEVIGWGEALERTFQSQPFARTRNRIDRIIVAMGDRRGTMPVGDLLNARLDGIRIEDATSLIEKISGRIEIEDLYPSALIFGDGFRLNKVFLFLRRMLSFAVALFALLCCLPIIPLVAAAVKLSSRGPVYFRQERVGLNGKTFTLFKFRTMRADAEAETGAVWAEKDDSRVTRIGSFLRRTRLDEIPQLWNVLKGDMSFVGPRPERPEFVQWLVKSIPYYQLRHIIRPGVTGWAQVKYHYCSSPEEAKEKLQYDLYYIKHISIVLDLLIMFETIKTVILRRGAQ